MTTSFAQLVRWLRECREGNLLTAKLRTGNVRIEIPEERIEGAALVFLTLPVDEVVHQWVRERLLTAFAQEGTVNEKVGSEEIRINFLLGLKSTV